MTKPLKYDQAFRVLIVWSSCRINDVQGVRETFADFAIEAVSTTYSLFTGKTKHAGEVLIRNF